MRSFQDNVWNYGKQSFLPYFSKLQVSDLDLISLYTLEREFTSCNLDKRTSYSDFNVKISYLRNPLATYTWYDWIAHCN